MDAANKSMIRYANYLSKNKHQPLQRTQFIDKFFQLDHSKEEEGKDLKKLELALRYIQQLNVLKYGELK